MTKGEQTWRWCGLSETLQSALSQRVLGIFRDCGIWEFYVPSRKLGTLIFWSKL